MTKANLKQLSELKLKISVSHSRTLNNVIKCNRKTTTTANKHIHQFHITNNCQALEFVPALPF